VSPENDSTPTSKPPTKQLQPDAPEAGPPTATSAPGAVAGTLGIDATRTPSLAATDEVHALVGYQYRLWKMRREDLEAEAVRVGLNFETAHLPKSLLIQHILEAQGIDDDILMHPPEKGS